MTAKKTLNEPAVIDLRSMWYASLLLRMLSATHASSAALQIQFFNVLVLHQAINTEYVVVSVLDA